MFEPDLTPFVMKDVMSGVQIGAGTESVRATGRGATLKVPQIRAAMI